MSKERELLKKVLAFLETDVENDFGFGSDIKELLAQPEQEPVAWKVIDVTNGEYMFSRVKPTERSYKYDVVIPLYTAPPTREPLSDEEVRAKYRDIALDNPLYVPSYYAGFRDAERAHGIGGGE